MNKCIWNPTDGICSISQSFFSGKQHFHDFVAKQCHATKILHLDWLSVWCTRCQIEGMRPLTYCLSKHLFTAVSVRAAGVLFGFVFVIQSVTTYEPVTCGNYSDCFIKIWVWIHLLSLPPLSRFHSVTAVSVLSAFMLHQPPLTFLSSVAEMLRLWFLPLAL